MLINPLTQQEITNDDLHEVATLCHNLKKVELEISQLEEKMKVLQERQESLSTVQIPESLRTLGLEEIKLSTGESVKVSKFYSCKIEPDKAEVAMDWLRNNGHGDLIKNTITISFGKGEDDTAELAAQAIIKMGLTPEQKIFVHPVTLKSFVKEMIESAKNLPTDLFGVYVGNRTKITEKK